MLGYVLRMEDNVPAKTLTIKAISDQQHMRKKDVAEAINIANDRKQWRDIFRLREDGRPSRSTWLGTF